MSRRFRLSAPWRTAGLLAFAALACLGCRSGDGEGTGALRWIEEPPADELRGEQLENVDCVHRVELADAVALGRSLDPDTAILAGVGGDGATLRGGLRSPRVRIGRTFAPGEISAARLVVAGVRRGEVRVSWSSPGASEELGAISQRPVFGGGALRDHFTLDFEGRIPTDRPVTIAIEPTTAAGEIVTVREICLGRPAVDLTRWRSLATLPWKATLADDTRDVVLVPPEGAVEKALELPRGARLRTAFGQIGGSPQEVRARVEVVSDGAPARRLFESRWTAEELGQGWREIEVDLSGVAPGEARLRLVVEGPAGVAHPLVGVWSAPRIWAEGRRRARPNVVLVSLDTVRADHLSLYGYSRPTTPRLEAWVRARGATVFQNVIAPSGWTLPSHFSLFTGLDAPRHLANYNSIALDTAGYTMFAEILNRAGYRTQAFTGGGFVHPLYGMAKGFESFAFWASKETREIELESNLERAQRFLDGVGDEPFLLFLHTYEAHTPNPARQPFFDRFSDLPSEWTVDVAPDPPGPAGGFLGSGHAVRRLTEGSPAEPIPAELSGLAVDAYDSALAYIDDRLAPLLDRLAAPPFEGRTLVAVFSDHGEALGEGGRVGHAHLALNNLKVPLVVAMPSRGAELTFPEQVRLHDLFPTLLDFLGLEVPQGLDARTLMPWLSGKERPASRRALAYSASTNHGLALLAPGGLKMEWRNSLWRPVAGERHWLRVDGFREEPIAEPATEEARELMREGERSYAQGAVGLGLRLTNRSPGPIEVALDSDVVDPASVKNRRMAGAQLDWRYIGHLEAPLEPGEVLDLQVERLLRRQVGLKLSFGYRGCPPAGVKAIELPVDDLRRARVETLPMPACPGAEGGPQGGGGLELRLEWRGPLPPGGGPRVDEALEAELRALGYLN